MPETITAATTRRLLCEAFDDMGERVARRRLDKLNNIVMSIWSGDQFSTLNYRDPTGEEAVRRVLAKL